MTACHEKGRNSGTAPHCVRDSDFDRLIRRVDGAEEMDGRLLAKLDEVAGQAEASHEVGRQVLQEICGVHSAIGNLHVMIEDRETRRDKACDIRHLPLDTFLNAEAIRKAIPTRAQLPTIDYDEGENTKVQTREQILGRAKESEMAAAVQTVRVVSLEERVAELTARLEERERASDRVRAQHQEDREKAVKSTELAIAKWKITTGFVVGVLLAIAAVGQAITSMVK